MQSRMISQTPDVLEDQAHEGVQIGVASQELRGDLSACTLIRRKPTYCIARMLVKGVALSL